MRKLEQKCMLYARSGTDGTIEVIDIFVTDRSLYLFWAVHEIPS